MTAGFSNKLANVQLMSDELHESHMTWSESGVALGQLTYNNNYTIAPTLRTA